MAKHPHECPLCKLVLDGHAAWRHHLQDQHQRPYPPRRCSSACLWRVDLIAELNRTRPAYTWLLPDREQS